MKLPPILLDQIPFTGPPRVEDEGTVYNATYHACTRYKERTGVQLTTERLLDCLDDPQAVWVDHEDGSTLVTYLSSPRLPFDDDQFFEFEVPF